MFVFLNDQVIVDKDSKTIAFAGSSLENYFLKGLSYKLTIKTTGTIEKVILFSSDQINNEDNSFTLTNEGNGVFSLEEEAGTNATAIENAQESNANFKDGIGFYFKVKVFGKNDNVIIDIKFHVKEPENVVLFGIDKIAYKSPFPVLIDELVNTVTFAPDAKNDAGVLLRGGIKTVQVLTDPNALSSGSHVNAIAETSVSSVTQITLPDRTSASKIPNFIKPAGFPDISNFYHFVTFRLRSKQGSSNFKDINVILFPIRECKNGTYGYDDSGDIFPKPLLLPLIPDDPPPPPPPDIPTQVCQSTTNIPFKPTGPLNVFASKTVVNVYSQSSGGDLLSTGTGTPTSDTNLQVKRVDMSGSTSVPVTGFAEIIESGPDRISTTRTEIIIFPCASIPIIITDLTIDEDTVTITITEESRDFDPTKTYEILLFDEKHGGTVIETFTPDSVTAREITFTLDEEKSGFWAIKEDGNFITGERTEKTIGPCNCETGTGTFQFSGTPESISAVLDGFRFGRCRWEITTASIGDVLLEYVPTGEPVTLHFDSDQDAYWIKGKNITSINERVWKLTTPDTTLDQPNGTFELVFGFAGGAEDFVLSDFKSCPGDPPPVCSCGSGSGTYDFFGSQPVSATLNFNQYRNFRCEWILTAFGLPSNTQLEYVLDGQAVRTGVIADQDAYWIKEPGAGSVWKLTIPETTLDQPNGTFEAFVGPVGDIILTGFKSCPENEGLF